MNRLIIVKVLWSSISVATPTVHLMPATVHIRILVEYGLVLWDWLILVQWLVLGFRIDMMEKLHSKGKTVEYIANCLHRVTLNPQIFSAIKAAHAHGYVLISFRFVFLHSKQGFVLNKHQELISQDTKKRVIIYIRDGGGDFCLTLKVKEEDHAIPRKDIPLHHLILKSSTPIKPKVHEWSDAEELNKILIQLIDLVSPKV
ncbi:inorganic pyrophosphatase 2-like [Bidens hawaiensis]|uniref:inorganic pyrophosphatase 2-like n=1 Tax=Bidens hawaiensis TaxID=980011 RepID=UPI004048EC14